MKFDFDTIKNLYEELNKQGFTFVLASDLNYPQSNKYCLIRHDVDFSTKKALQFATFERDLGVKSTFYFLLRSDFYNLLSPENVRIISTIQSYGHEIGLHFDASIYTNTKDLKQGILNEISIFETITGITIKSFSFHRPSPDNLESNLKIHNLINLYHEDFFKKILYVSDSRNVWRRNPFDEIKKEKSIQILIHPIWYDCLEKDTKTILMELLKEYPKEMYRVLQREFSNLNEFVEEKEL